MTIEVEKYYSQLKAEDTILEWFERLGTMSKRCCEIGGWDGIHYSNTAYLVRHLGWRGCFIEINRERSTECLMNYRDFNAQVICSNVTVENVNALVPDDTEFLSIDVDGNDYWLLEALKIRPTLICVEYNPDRSGAGSVMSYDHHYVRVEGDHIYGCSKQALASLADKKRYEVVHNDGLNLFMIPYERASWKSGS